MLVFEDGVKIEPLTREITTLIKISDKTVNNSTTFQDDNDLIITLQANKNYIVKVILFFISSAVADLKTKFEVPTNGSLKYNDNSGSTNVMLDETDAKAHSGTGLELMVHLIGVLDTGDGGIFKLTWAQNTLEASNTILKAKTCMELIEIT